MSQSQFVGLPSASVSIPPHHHHDVPHAATPAHAPASSSAGSDDSGADGAPRCPMQGMWRGKGVAKDGGSGVRAGGLDVVRSVSSGGSGGPSATCPFAAVLPASREPIAVTAADGTVVHVRRRCPAWIRVLRVTAKYIARTVLTRTAKGLLMTAYHSARRASRQRSSSASLASADSHPADSENADFGSDFYSALSFDSNPPLYSESDS